MGNETPSQPPQDRPPANAPDGPPPRPPREPDPRLVGYIEKGQRPEGERRSRSTSDRRGS